MLDKVKDVSPCKQTWKLKVRVIGLWPMCRINESDKPFAVEMVVVDSEGSKIQATIRKPMLRKFSFAISEGAVYIMSYFGVVDNRGSYRATHHEYKMLFHFKTSVILCDDTTIPLNVFSLMNSDDINNTNGSSDYFVDVIGIMRSVSAEKVSVKDGKTTRLIQLELEDESGVIKCSLFGAYVDSVNEFVSRCGDQLPIVVLQFGQVKYYNGGVVVQNLMNTSRLIWEPETNEAIVLRNRLISKGMDLNVPLAAIGNSRNFVTPSQDFLEMYPRKTITQLHTTEEEGIFIVMAKIICVLNVDQWYYLACKCHRAVANKDNLYYCSACQINVVNVVPRYRLKVEVFDGNDTAAFIIFDSDCSYLLQQSCAIVVKEFKEPNGNEHPSAFHKLIGAEILFKVEKDAEYSFRFDDSFRVKKVCDDVAIIQNFKSGKDIHTPLNSKIGYVPETITQTDNLIQKSSAPVEDVTSIGDDQQMEFIAHESECASESITTLPPNNYKKRTQMYAHDKMKKPLNSGKSCAIEDVAVNLAECVDRRFASDAVDHELQPQSNCTLGTALHIQNTKSFDLIQGETSARNERPYVNKFDGAKNKFEGRSQLN